MYNLVGLLVLVSMMTGAQSDRMSKDEEKTNGQKPYGMGYIPSGSPFVLPGMNLMPGMNPLPLSGFVPYGMPMSYGHGHTNGEANPQPLTLSCECHVIDSSNSDKKAVR